MDEFRLTIRSNNIQPLLITKKTAIYKILTRNNTCAGGRRGIMEPVTLVTTVVGVLSQVALALKGAKSILDKYGDDALQIGKQIYQFVQTQFENDEETKGEVEYFSMNPEQEKRQQAMADSLAVYIQQNEEFRKELEKLIVDYQEAVPNKAIEETIKSITVDVKIGNVTDSNINIAGGDITTDPDSK